MNGRKSIQTWGERARILARIWVCGHCGVKLYCGRLTTRPAYRCMCGKASWRQLESPFTASRG